MSYMRNGVQMKKWEIRIKQYEYSLCEGDIQKRSKKNYEVEEILSDFGKDGYELVNIITEKYQITRIKINTLELFFLKKREYNYNNINKKKRSLYNAY